MRQRLFVALLATALAVLALPAMASAEPAFTAPEDCTDSTFFHFEYNDSDEVGIDTGCADKNEVTRSQVPGLIANELHVSCSDKFEGGVGQKSDLGDPDRRVTDWVILKIDKKGKIKKTCGEGDPCVGTPGGCTPPCDPSDPDGGCFVCDPSSPNYDPDSDLCDDTEIPAGGPIGYMAAVGGIGALYLVARNLRRRGADGSAAA